MPFSIFILLLGLRARAESALDRALGFRDLVRSCEGRVSANFPPAPKIVRMADVANLAPPYAVVFRATEGEEGTALVLYPRARQSHGVQIDLVNVTKTYDEWRTIETYSRLYRKTGRIPRHLRETGRLMERSMTAERVGSNWISIVRLWINAELMDATTYEAFVRKLAVFEKEPLF